MLDSETKGRINTARDILVGKVPDPKSQVEQITIALIYKFMDDMDVEAEELGGKRTFFSSEYAKYSWRKIFDPRQSGHELLNLYSEAIAKMDTNPGVPKLFRDIFKNAYLPYRDPETLKAFLKIINEFNYSHSEKLGDAFEFLLSILGSQGDAGQFRTPRHIIDFMVAIMDPKKHEVILDPACGTAGFLISSYKHIIKQNSTNFIPDENPKVENIGSQSVNEVIITSNGYNGDKLTASERIILADNMHGYDISPDMVRLSLVNMYLHGIKEPQIFEYDSLTSEDHWNEYSDVILANPPFMSPKGGIRPHKRFSVQSNRSEVLFVDYIAEHLTQDGRAAVIVPEGIIFQSGNAYKQLRKMLVEKYLVGVISLPAGVFQPYSGVKTSILWLDKSLAKKTDKILFVKIENDGFDLGSQRRYIKDNDLPFLTKVIASFKVAATTGNPISPFNDRKLIFVDRKDITKNADINLTASRYILDEKKSSKYSSVFLHEVCDLQNGYAFKSSDYIEKSNTCNFRMSNIRPDGGIDLDHNARYLPDDYAIKYQEFLVKEGDVVIAMTDMANDPKILGVPTIVRKDYRSLLLNQRVGKFGKIDHNRLYLPYLKYILNSQNVKEYYKSVGGGGLQINISKKDILSLSVPLPPLFIQKEIVVELESYQKIIDGARQVVENYKPRIYIDPEWEMVQLGEVCTINPKKSELKGLPGDMEVSFVPMADINENLMTFDAKQKKPLHEVLKSYTYFRNEDILLARVTPCFENGKAGIASNLMNKIGFGSSEYTVLRCKKGVLPTWIYIWVTTDSFRNSGKLQMTGTGGLQRVPNDFVCAYKVPVPAIKIQEDIITQIHIEQEIIESNKKFIQIFEQKIKDRIAKVWGGDGARRDRKNSEEIIEIIHL
jgi:type I restriction enzyme M protein